MKLRASVTQLYINDVQEIHVSIINALSELEDKGKTKIIGWGGISFSKGNLYFSVITLDGLSNFHSQYNAPIYSTVSREKSCEGGVALIIPTGVGASRGGYIGDASPIVKLFESVFTTVITNPNTVNGADQYGASNSLYVEGLMLDRFLSGMHYLRPVASNRIGVIIDQLSKENKRNLLNTINAAKSVLGLDIVGYVTTDEKLHCDSKVTVHGHYVGELLNPKTLVDAAEELVRSGATAIAIVSEISGVPIQAWRDHYAGHAVNPVGSVEAMISRFVSHVTGLPSAHAPAYIGQLDEFSSIADPRAAAEVVSKTGLTCVLKGLSKAPQASEKTGTVVSDLDAIIVPADCSVGAPLVSSLYHEVPLLLVEDNNCSVGINACNLGYDNLVKVKNYAEALSWVIAKRSGIEWSAITGKVARVREINKR